MELSRVCYESASAAGVEARRQRMDAWAAEMHGVTPEAALELAKLFDQSLEFDPYITDGEYAEALDRIAPHLRLLEIRTLADLPGRLPVFPIAASEALQLAMEPETCVSELERMAKADPVLAGSIISAANSSLFGTRQPISELRRAITHLGTDTARNVLLATAVRPVFGTSRFRPLWLHSLEIAQACDRLARLSGMLSAGEAFLSGLMHDVGRVALLLVPPEAVAASERLVKAGCPPVAVERALFGTEHCELGAHVLESWKFNQRLVEAARFHHRPERTPSVHAAMVYAAEFRSGADEELPSLARLKAACETIRVDIEVIAGVSFDEESSAFSGLTA